MASHDMVDLAVGRSTVPVLHVQAMQVVSTKEFVFVFPLGTCKISLLVRLGSYMSYQEFLA